MNAIERQEEMLELLREGFRNGDIALVGNATNDPAGPDVIDNHGIVCKVNLGFYYPGYWRGYRSDVVFIASKEFIKPALKSAKVVIWVGKFFKSLLKKKYHRQKNLFFVEDEFREYMEAELGLPRPSAGLQALFILLAIQPENKISVFGMDGYRSQTLTDKKHSHTIKPNCPHDFIAERAFIDRLSKSGTINYWDPLETKSQKSETPVRLRLYRIKKFFLNIKIINFSLQKFYPRKL